MEKYYINPLIRKEHIPIILATKRGCISKWLQLDCFPAAMLPEEDEQRKIAFRRGRQRRSEDWGEVLPPWDWSVWQQILWHSMKLRCFPSIMVVWTVCCFIFSCLQGGVGCYQAQCEFSAYTTGLQWMCLYVVDMLVAETWFMIILYFIHRGAIKCFIGYSAYYNMFSIT